jgi:hypothetical protein
MLRVFISYSSKSKPKVQNLAQDLEMAGHQIWFDHKLTGGQAWWDQILEQIRQCEMFIFALTPDALDSYPCKLEYTYAHDLGKHVLPVLLADGVSVNLLPSALTTIQFVDYRSNDKQAAFRLMNAISGLPPCSPLPDPLPPSPPVPISYIGNLKEQIDSPSPLTFDEQAALVIKIKEHLQNPDSHDDAATLLRQMRKREDLYARIGEEIDSLLKPAAPAPEPAPRVTPVSAPTPEPYRAPQSATMPAQQRVVVTPPRSTPTAVGGDQPWNIWLMAGLVIGTYFLFPIGLVAGFIGLRSPAKRNQGIGLLVFGGIMGILNVIVFLQQMSYYGW